MKTLAAVMVAPFRVELMELTLPPLRSGHCLVRIEYSGICGTVLGQINGDRGPDAWLPHLIGHEGTGTILETGRGVTRVSRGDVVCLSWIAARGIDEGGSVYRADGGRQVNSGPVATLASHVVVSENRLTRLPVRLTLEQGVLLGCAAPTGLGAILNVALVLPREKVAVWGCGAVGLMAVAAADHSEAASIIAIDGNPARLELATSFGATVTSGSEEAGAAMGQCDIAIVAVGSTDAIRSALSCVKPRGGRVVVIGNAPHGEPLVLDPAEFNQGKSILGTWGGDSEPDRDNSLYAEIVDQVAAERVLSQPYQLADVNRAIVDFASGLVCRPLISMVTLSMRPPV